MTVREFRRAIGGSKAPHCAVRNHCVPCQVRRLRSEDDGVPAARQQRSTKPRRRYPVGAEITDGGVSFRVWAPKRRHVAVVIESGGEHAEHALSGRAGRLFQRLRARQPARRPLPLPSRRRRDALSRSRLALPARGAARALAGRRSRRVPLDGRGLARRRRSTARSSTRCTSARSRREGTWAAAAEQAAVPDGHRHHG